MKNKEFLRPLQTGACAQLADFPRQKSPEGMFPLGYMAQASRNRADVFGFVYAARLANFLPDANDDQGSETISCLFWRRAEL
jgi:hypothetical protein